MIGSFLHRLLFGSPHNLPSTDKRHEKAHPRTRVDPQEGIRGLDEVKPPGEDPEAETRRLAPGYDRRELSISLLLVRLMGDQLPEEEAMKYMLLIHQGDAPTPRSPDEWATLSEDEQKAVYADYQAINQTPGVTPGLGLDAPETATTVRVQDGKTLTTDGPFVEIKEAIGGYLLFEADDLDAAIELASRIPAARLGGAVEVRPIVEW
jgi:hypothetical protein